jgi:hypothetical protein
MKLTEQDRIKFVARLKAIHFPAEAIAKVESGDFSDWELATPKEVKELATTDAIPVFSAADVAKH